MASSGRRMTWGREALGVQFSMVQDLGFRVEVRIQGLGFRV